MSKVGVGVKGRRMGYEGEGDRGRKVVRNDYGG